MIARAKKCLPFPGLCAFHSLPVCGSLFMREINGWETSAENSALFVCAIPATFHSSLVLYLSFFPLFSQNNQLLQSCGGYVTGWGFLQVYFRAFPCERILLQSIVLLTVTWTAVSCVVLSINLLFHWILWDKVTRRLYIWPVINRAEANGLPRGLWWSCLWVEGDAKQESWVR